MKRLLLGLALAVMFAGLFSVNSFACDNGCTPGYWKQAQHFDSWIGYTPSQALCVDGSNGGVFTCPAGLELKKGTSLATATLLDALQSGGGGLDALLRHAVAALLNAQRWPCEDMTENGLISTVSAVMDGSPATIEFLKDQLADENEDYCPLH